MHRIAITTGEPAGIGPDVVLQTAQQAWPIELVVFADPDLLLQRAKQLKLDIHLNDFNETTVQSNKPGQLSIVPCV